MIGIVVAAHQSLAQELVRAAEGIVGRAEQVRALTLSYDEPTERARRRLERALAEADTGDGVLLLTDLFGGTPTNLGLPFLEPGRVEVLAGVNLPMLVKALTARNDMDLVALAAFLRDYGRRNIVLASEIWNRRPGT